MSVYQRKFSFNNRSNTDFGFIVCTITPDNGEVSSYLTMESVYTDSFDGSIRYDYGAKYTDRVVLYITMLKNNYADVSRAELRETLNWLTGLRKASWLDLYNDESGEVEYSFFGRITDVKLQKMDSRIIGIKAEFTSVSPWAYSKINRREESLSGSNVDIYICNCSDEDSVYVYPKVTFINKIANGTLDIVNNTTGEHTILQHLAMNEVITIDSNKIIYSDNAAKVFGDDFNFVFLRFAQGYNYLSLNGTGHIIIDHRDMLKVADAFDDNDCMNLTPADINLLRLIQINLAAADWVEENVPIGNIATYSQAVSIQNVDENSRINLQANDNQLLELQANEIELQIINDNGIITAYAYGSAPVNNYTVQATVEDTSVDISHRYTTLTLYANGWSGQGSVYTQPIYIKDLTEHSIVDIDLSDVQIATLEGSETTLFIENDNGSATAHAIGFRPEIDYTVNLIITETTTNINTIGTHVDQNNYAEPMYF